MSISDFWRIGRSSDPSKDLVSVKDGCETILRIMGVKRPVIWGQRGSCPGDKIILDYTPLKDQPSPFPGERVDAVMGIALHEGGHSLFSDPQGPSNIKARVKHPRDKHLISEIYSIVEDYYVDKKISQKSEIFAHYIETSRKVIGANYHELPLFHRLSKNRPTREDIITAFGLSLLYGISFPEISEEAKKILTRLLMHSQRIPQAEIPEERGKIAYEIYEQVKDLRAGWRIKIGLPRFAEKRREDKFLPKRLWDKYLDYEEKLKGDIGAATIGVLGGAGSQEVIMEEANYNPELQERYRLSTFVLEDKLRSIFEERRRYEYIRGLLEGRLRTRVVARAGAGDRRVFEKRETPEKIGFCLALVLDMSGSMVGSPLEIVRAAATAFHDAFYKENLDLIILGYTTKHPARTVLYRIYDKEIAKLHLEIGEHGGTPTGYALAGAKILIEKLSPHWAKRLIIHITDGFPEDVSRLREAISKLKLSGIDLFTISTREEVDRLREQYGEDFTIIKTITELPLVMEEIVRRKAG